MEIVVLNEIRYNFTTNNVAIPAKVTPGHVPMKVAFKFPFESVNKRMTVLCTTDPSKNEYQVFTKGAPEVLRSLLATVPRDYDEMYKRHMIAGERILALATKTMTFSGYNQVYSFLWI